MWIIGLHEVYHVHGQHCKCNDVISAVGWQTAECKSIISCIIIVSNLVTNMMQHIRYSLVYLIRCAGITFTVPIPSHSHYFIFILLPENFYLVLYPHSRSISIHSFLFPPISTLPNSHLVLWVNFLNRN